MLSEHVGVKAPGTPKITTFLFAVISDNICFDISPLLIIGSFKEGIFFTTSFSELIQLY